MLKQGLALTACAALLLACAQAPPPPPPTGPAGDIFHDVAYLAGPALEGRGTGTAGNDLAAQYIARRFMTLGLAGPFGGDSLATARCDSNVCARAYFHRFNANGIPAQNVGALVPGTDPVLRGQLVVLGAHYDHLGRSPAAALDAEWGAVVRPGADDNASGTAALLELARRLAASPPRRSVLLLAFGAEELGLLGSRALVRDPPTPLDSVVAMINLDMVGRLRNRPLKVYGAIGRPLRALLDSAAAAAGVRLAVRDVLKADSDHYSFAAHAVPALQLFTGTHGDYHRSGDTPARIDAPGIARIADLAERLTRLIADRPARLR